MSETTKQILILGAGKSSVYLIDELLRQAAFHGWQVTVADASLAAAHQKIKAHPCGTAVALDASEEAARQVLIATADVVVSLLPPHLHLLVAQDCLALGSHLVTASYISPAMRAMDAEARAAGLCFMNEIGLDPGIDHLSAMEIIHRLQAEGAQIDYFLSATGGLVAPESDNNPWHYKISWNPRNVVLAGQGIAQYREAGRLRYVPYAQLFSQTQRIRIGELGEFDAYPNRDSLAYHSLYGLEDAPTLLRATLRRAGYCQSWQLLVRLGLTDDNTPLQGLDGLTWAEWITGFIPTSFLPLLPLPERVAQWLGCPSAADPDFARLVWLGLFSDEPIGKTAGTAAQLLQQRIERSWAMQADDKDMIVMLHEFHYTKAGRRERLQATLVVKGENQTYTAMAKTVGLPAALFVKSLLLGEVRLTGVHLPIQESVYRPLLQSLAAAGIVFDEQVSELPPLSY